MKILIEQYGYDKERLSKLLDPHYYTELRDGKAKIPYVGYFLSHKIPDVVMRFNRSRYCFMMMCYLISMSRICCSCGV